jgi:phenylpropionate dioxygenase-like ring-hydroxylating dioxygenase large terminal subunit
VFIKNAWYVVAWDYEVLGDTILERSILGESVIVYRTAAGTPVVLENRCCHRGAPLALGRKEGDCIRCMYHGLKFASSGECVEIPGQDRIPAGAMVKSYPAAQRTRFIWVWMGDRNKADVSLIPDTYSVQHSQWRTKPGYKLFRANIALIADNLLDFSHLSYVHESSLGGSAAIAAGGEQEISVASSGGIRIVRKINNVDPAPYHRRLLTMSGKVNRWWEYELSLSGMFIMTSGAQSVDRAPGDLEGALMFHSCQALTPESESSTHYFFSHAHNFSLDDPTVTEATYQSIAAAFGEDSRMIEGQSQVLARTPDRDFVGIAADSALTRYRRMVRAALEAERGAPSSQSAA